MTDHERVGDDPEDTLIHIQSRFDRETLRDVFQPFIDLRRYPSDKVLDAIGAVTGSSHNEVRRFIARQAKQAGSDFMSEHLPNDR